MHKKTPKYELGDAHKKVIKWPKILNMLEYYDLTSYFCVPQVHVMWFLAKKEELIK